MNLKPFLTRKEVWLSLLSLLGQLMIVSITSFMLLNTDISMERAAILVIVILGFAFVIAVTILRLLNLAKVMGLYCKE
ncbi:hypothetical protein RE476_06955 [Methanolobus mangrovi]|uniref:Uncharacterized protein n=1 Tax=Methanolobus mangrovi TaxID=3072977 RepID=A0AA51YI47_9EURY|nr:hypothetical protein [Methanolobus mangrovi]WMW21153.1 hypothetical protein RE476_06955 [Methanolobus mangrovi]